MTIKLIKRLGLQSRQGLNMGRKEDKRRGFRPGWDEIFCAIVTLYPYFILGIGTVQS